MYACRTAKYRRQSRSTDFLEGPEGVNFVGQNKITEEKTIPQIKQFVESGGTVVTVGSSTSMAELLGVPVSNSLIKPPEAAAGKIACPTIGNETSVDTVVLDQDLPIHFARP
jgi:hypothetical protein